MKNNAPSGLARRFLNMENIMALLRSILYLGILDKSRKDYWKLVFWSLNKRPDLLPLAVTYSIYGYHFRKVYRINS